MSKKLDHYPAWTCKECALLNGGRIIEGHISCIHEAKCDCCEKIKMVCQPRDYGYPNFNVRRKTTQSFSKQLEDIRANMQLK